MRGVMAGLVAAMVAGPVMAGACDAVVTVPLVPSDVPEGCEWRTVEPWAPPDGCGNAGFEVVGWGPRPGAVIFKRANTVYVRNWETRALDTQGGPAWTSGSLGDEDKANRCFAGWCKPVGYILRTAEAGVCGQRVELRVRLTADRE